MSFPRYPAYKESGIEWLGAVPSHWAVKRLRFVAALNPSKSEVSHLAPDTEVSFLPMEAIGEDGSLELERVRPLADVQTGYTFFRDGDVTIAKITPCFENGKGAAMRDLCNGIGFGTTELIVTRPKATQTTSTYLHWLFTSRPFRKAGEAFMYGAGGQKRVPDDFVRDFAIGFPPLPEQHHIVTFLDREAAKIDTLVEEQRRLIELLKEKRQAVISQAVTKGLSPNAPMKESGLDWLGLIPAHWAVTCIKRFATLQRGHDLTDAERTEGDHPVITSGGRSGTHGAYMVRGPGVVTGRYGSTGKLFFLEDNYWPHNTTLYVRDFHGNDPRFVWYSLQTVDFGAYSAKSAVPGIDRNDIHPLPVVVPSQREQREIVNFLDLEMAKIDALTAEAQQGVELLQERRAALISAAVTGKIDVRGLVPQPEAVAG